jgi:hypothetical protein
LVYRTASKVYQREKTEVVNMERHLKRDWEIDVCIDVETYLKSKGLSPGLVQSITLEIDQILVNHREK